MNRFRIAICVGCVMFAGIGLAAAADRVSEPCIHSATNARVVWKGIARGDVRVYFRSDLAKTEHYVAMTPGAGGIFWAMLPKPNGETVSIDYRVATIDAQGRATNRAEGRLSVSPACAATALSPDEAKFAASLVVGSDSEGPAIPVGFQCDGIVGRIVANRLQAYDACSEEALALARAPRTLIAVPPAQKVVTAKTSTSTTLQSSLLRIGTNGLAIVPLHHRTPRRAPLPPTPPQPRLSEPVSPSRP